MFSNKKHKNVNIRQKNTMYSQLFQGRGQTGAVQLWHLYVSMLGFDDHLWRWNGTLHIFRYKQSYACDFTLIFCLACLVCSEGHKPRTMRFTSVQTERGGGGNADQLKSGQTETMVSPLTRENLIQHDSSSQMLRHQSSSQFVSG